MDNIENNEKEVCDAGYVHIELIEPTKENRYHLFKHNFFVDSSLHGVIFGKKGKMISKLCLETKTKITVPKKGQTGDVVITGIKKTNVLAARKSIDLLLKKCTHFISIPLNSDEIKQNFIEFKNELLKKDESIEIPIVEEMFQKPDKLHLKIVMLILENDEDKEKAIKLLKKCEEEIIRPIIEENGPLNVQLKGIQCMGDDNPSKVTRLHIKVHDEKDNLQKIAGLIADRFIDYGLSRKQCDKVNLHVAALNTDYLRKSSQDENFKRQIIDATKICKDYESTNFGQETLSTFHISILDSYEENENLYYEPLFKIDF